MSKLSTYALATAFTVFFSQVTLVCGDEADKADPPDLNDIKYTLDLLEGKPLILIPGLNRFNRPAPGTSDKNGVTNELKLSKEQLLKLAVVREEFAEFEDRRRQSRISSLNPDGTRLTFEEFQAKLAERQKSKVDPVSEGRQIAADTDRKVREILGEDGVKRLDEIVLYQLGATRLLRSEVRQRLGLSLAQCFRIDDALVRNLPDRLFHRNQTDSLGFDCYEILTENQRAAWSEMIGAPVDGVERFAQIVPRTELPEIVGVRQPQFPEPSAVQFPPMFLKLRIPVVARELNFSEEQKKELAQIAQKAMELQQRIGLPAPPTAPSAEASQRRLEEYRERIAEQKKLEDAALALLTDIQKIRLNQIDFQRKNRPILSREFRTVAELTDEQIEQIANLIPGPNPHSPWSNDFEMSVPTMSASRQADHAKYVADSQKQLPDAVKLLTEKQMLVWEEMAGAILSGPDLISIPVGVPGGLRPR